MVASPSGSPLLVALYGPTASGKTRLSVELAHRIRRTLGLEPVVVSADSRQVYRYMDIGTAKATPEEMRGIPHELIDVAEPVRKLELEEYVPLARAVVDQALRDGRVPMIVGGTGVYVGALLEGWHVDRTGATRQSLRSDFPRAMAADAYRTLRRLDRGAAARVHPNNYEGIINALAAAMSGASAARGEAAPGVRRVVLGLDPGQRALDDLIARRLAAQLEAGLFDEVCSLAARYDLDRAARRERPDPNQVLQTIGYREFFERVVARGRRVADLDRADLDAVGREVIEHTRAHARRQRAWFRKLPGVRMIGSARQAASLVAAGDTNRRGPHG